MADDKRGRDKQAHDEERRQRERELDEALERGDEAEPADALGAGPDEFEAILEEHEYPTTTDELVEALGDREATVRGSRRSIGDLLAPVDDETHESAADVRDRIRKQLRRR